MSQPNAVVLVLDGLGSNNLGPYGNTWLDTPAWNRLAAHSSLVETAIVDSIDLETIYRSFMYGKHALDPLANDVSESLACRLDQNNIESWLVTDDPSIADSPTVDEFSERVIVPTRPECGPAAMVEETHLARFFATLIDVLDQASPPFLIWAHSQGLRGQWDAPYELRCQFAEEDDPDPPDIVAVPDRQLELDFDPDELLGLVHANAGQVVLLDICLDALLDAVRSSPVIDSLGIVATSPRGLPLGEQLWVGPSDRTLSTNLLQVPWIMQWPREDSCCERIQQLVQPPDLFPTLLDWFNVSFDQSRVWGRSLINNSRATDSFGIGDRAVVSDGDHRLIRVPNWSLRISPDEPPHLFVKPDDRWEVNEVSDRCLSTVELLTTILDNFEKAAAAGDRSELIELPADLK